MTGEQAMSRPKNFQIDVDHDFPHLPRAPIVEAVIHWQASPSRTLDREELKRDLEQRFTDYSLHAQHRIEAALSASAEGVEARQRTRWGGFRLTSANEKHVCQVTPNAVVFSRLAPYKDWPTFVTEALRYWDAFVALAAPVSVERLGVRFINQIELKETEQAADVVQETPGLPESIGLRPESFFRQDTMAVPDYPYRVNLVRVIQGLEPPMVPQRSLIVDIDVFAAGLTNVDRATIDQRLSEMRYLKNFIFFNFLKQPEKRFGAK
jgi:uncharacterized protein (TIGR04255 family)